MDSKEITVVEEFQKNPQLKEKDLQQLREWISAEHPLYTYFNDCDLILFLHSCNYNLKYTERTITHCLNSYFTCADFFTNLDLKDKKALMTQNTQLLFPIQLQSKDVVLITRFMDPNPQHFILSEVVKQGYMMQCLLSKNLGTVPGFQVISDMSNFGFGHMLKINVLTLRRLMHFIQEGAPIRVKKIHFVNAEPWMDRLFNLLRSFLKKELKNMIQIHTSFETLYEFIPQQDLPEEYGGSGNSLEVEHGNVKNWFLKNENILREQGERIQAYQEARTKQNANNSLINRWGKWLSS